MKNILFYLIILCSSSLVAQFSFNTNATGIQSATNNASGPYSTAMGYNTTASGDQSTAMGFYPIASGNYSTAMGYYTVAQDFGTIAIGRYNNTDETPNPSQFLNENTALVIGNGLDNNNRSNAFKVLFNGTTTIAGNVTAPAFIGDGSQLTNIFSGQFNDLINAPIRSFDSNNFIETPYSQSRAPFSVALGAATRTLGEYSFAMGYSSEAVGKNAVAFGEGVIASGTGAVAMGNYSRTNGDGAVALGNGTEARNSGFAAGEGTFAGTEAAALGFNTAAVGGRSFAVGEISRAEGWASAAIGYRPEAHGNYSIAMGGLAKTYGEYSIAIGNQAIANAKHSFSLGTHTKTSEYNTFAIGHYNLASREVSAEGSATEYDLDNTAFAIGNGTYNAPSDALVVKFNGNTTIAGNVTAPAFIGDGSQLTNLPAVSYSDLTNVPLSFNENELGGIQSPLAVASGGASTALGAFNNATGDQSTAMGNYTEASGTSSTAMGFETKAIGSFSVATGNQTTAFGSLSTAMGFGTNASGYASSTLGYDTNANGSVSTAMGLGTTASGETATAVGQFTTASGKFSLGAGLYSNASGTTSVALGNNTIADGYGTLATGYFNTPNSNPQADTFTPTNTAFVIGNGTYENRSNALEVLFDGTTTIAGDLNINSDARLKANIISLGATLSKLLQIDGKTYTMKKDANHKKKIGLLAQDIEKVFPELVTETNDIKSVNYQGLVPVLINAMKEQQEEIDELKALVKQLLEK